jgi:hypothetical protein
MSIPRPLQYLRFYQVIRGTKFHRAEILYHSPLNVWTGGKRIGGTDAFTWQDGSSLASPGYFTNWAHGFPHSSDSSRACVQLIRATGQWEDVSCSSTLNYVLCQKNLQLDIWKLQDIVIQTRSQLWGNI